MKMCHRLFAVLLLCVLAFPSVSCSGRDASVSGSSGSAAAEDAASLDTNTASAENASFSDVKGTISSMAADGAAQTPVYQNPFFGLSFSLPSSWHFTAEDQLADMNLSAASDPSGNAAAASFSPAEGQAWYDMYAASEDGSENANITIQNIRESYGAEPDTELLIDDTLGTLQSALEDSGVTDLQIKKSTVQFLGESSPAILVSGTVKGISFYERQVCRIKGSYLLCVTAVSYSADRTSEILDDFVQIL